MSHWGFWGKRVEGGKGYQCGGSVVALVGVFLFGGKGGRGFGDCGVEYERVFLMSFCQGVERYVVLFSCWAGFGCFVGLCGRWRWLDIC